MCDFLTPPIQINALYLLINWPIKIFISTAVSRSLDNPEQTEVRIQNNCISTAVSRSLENPEQTEVRLQNNLGRTLKLKSKKWTNFIGAAFSYNTNADYTNHPCLTIGCMTVVCPFCNATKFKGETSGQCYKSGRVQLLNLHDPPEPLNHLMLGDIPESRHFLENIRKSNSCFQMTSFGVTKEAREPGCMPTFKIQGQVYHTAGSLLPLPEEDPRFLQIYFIGNDAEETNQ